MGCLAYSETIHKARDPLGIQDGRLRVLQERGDEGYDRGLWRFAVWTVEPGAGEQENGPARLRSPDHLIEMIGRPRQGRAIRNWLPTNAKRPPIRGVKVWAADKTGREVEGTVDLPEGW